MEFNKKREQTIDTYKNTMHLKNIMLSEKKPKTDILSELMFQKVLEQTT